MHFSQTYAQLLATLPPELRDNPFEYQKLKQLINQTTRELDSLGLGPSVLRSLRKHEKQDELEPADPKSVSDTLQQRTITYEFVLNSSIPEPRLRLASGCLCDIDAHHTSSTAQPIYRVDLLIPEQLFNHVMRTLHHPPINGEERFPDHLLDLTIPIPSDVAFFHLLTSSLISLSCQLDALKESFDLTLNSLAVSISSTARPVSYSTRGSFSAYSVTADNIMSLRPKPGGKSDLYVWREIFRVYAEAEVFETVKESTLGERSIEEVERNLELFRGRVQCKKASLLLPGSGEAFDMFLNLNLFILSVKKLQVANSEAIRKILKKHAKHTTFSIPLHLLERTPAASSRPLTWILPSPSRSLPRLLVQAIGEILLPIIPHIDHYTCLICTSIAFKPIRLSCGHFFCVRCLVKMQKRCMENCPMCRSPTVLRANPSNLDYGLLNLMADWFPVESLEKLRANDREVTKEQMVALGMSDDHICRVM